MSWKLDALMILTGLSIGFLMSPLLVTTYTVAGTPPTPCAQTATRCIRTSGGLCDLRILHHQCNRRNPQCTCEDMYGGQLIPCDCIL